MKRKANGNIDPIVNVVPAEVTYIDSRSANQLADAETDSNVMLALCSLFGGGAISFVIALITSKAILLSCTIFCVLLSFIFLLLTIRSRNKVKETKKLLFNNMNSK